MDKDKKTIIAVPKGRILPPAMEVLSKIGIKPEDDFNKENNRRLRFTTNIENIDIIRVRSFDVATFVAFGAAEFGIAGKDVLMEYDYSELYIPLDLGIGKCRLVVAERDEDILVDDPNNWSHVRIATKYPNLTRKYFAERGVQAECIRLSGAMELAPSLGLCRRIVDLVETGNTLRANGLAEVAKISDVSSCLIVNRAAMKIKPDFINSIINSFTEIIDGKTS